MRKMQSCTRMAWQFVSRCSVLAENVSSNGRAFARRPLPSKYELLMVRPYVLRTMIAARAQLSKPQLSTREPWTPDIARPTTLRLK